MFYAHPSATLTDRPLEPDEGKGLAILRPGVLGLTVNRAAPFAPPPRFLESAMGVRRRPATASGSCRRFPLPRAASGDPTPITPSVLLPRVFDPFIIYNHFP